MERKNARGLPRQRLARLPSSAGLDLVPSKNPCLYRRYAMISIAILDRNQNEETILSY